MIKSMMLGALICIVPVSLEGCSPVTTQSAALATAPFPHYRTFSFGTVEAAPAGFRATPRTAEVERRMQSLVAAVLTEKGYALAETGKKGDVVIAVGSGSRKGIKRPTVVSRSGDSASDDDANDFVEGSIVIDMFDGTNDGAVWHGAGRTEVNPDKINPELLQQAVREVLAPFPSRTAPPQATR